jgi:1,4-alpha-glucan branching enzyme
MGGELGQESEWAESRELDWWLLDHPEHRGVHDVVRDLNRVYRDAPALWTRDGDPDGFGWLVADDTENNVFAFVRHGAEDTLVCVTNFSPVPRHGYVLGMPSVGVWDEVLNTDAEVYAGSGVGNLGSVTAEPGESHGQPAHAAITVPPLATVWFRRAS